MTVRCDHKFVLVGIDRSWRTQGADKKLFEKTEHYSCTDCGKDAEKKQFEYALSPPPWFTRDGQES